MYHAYGKSVMSSVSAPTPWGEPLIWPSGGVGGGATGVGAAERAVVTVGSSLSLGRGSPGARGGRPGSGRPGDWSRAGRSRAGRSREGSRWGRSVGVGRGGGSCSGCWRPCGTPTAAMAGTRLTMTGLGSLPPHTALPQSTAAPKAAWKMTETSVDLTRSEEHTSELQSRFDLVCRLLLEKKKKYRFGAVAAHNEFVGEPLRMHRLESG